MTDIKSPEARSKNMAAIRSKDTKPELYLRKLLFSKGYRYRNNVSYIKGRPDIWLAKYNTAIFVHGCFWHRHKNCKYAYFPNSKQDFWNKKFEDNIRRDNNVKESLIHEGIKCLIIWECTLKRMALKDDYKKEMLQIIETFFNNSEYFAEL